VDEPRRSRHGAAARLSSGGGLRRRALAAIADDARRIYGVQFHPEVVHTPRGAALLRNFTHKVAGLSGDWTMAAFRRELVDRLRRQVGKERVICGLSGGVDSSVAAVLIHEAIGEQLTCIFVDHGLLRQNEASEVVELFRGHYNIPLVHRDASAMFLSKLAGVSDPERKRKIIGATFIDVFEEEAAKIGGAELPRPGHALSRRHRIRVLHGGPSVTIKSHHNVGGLPERMRMKLVEPLRELFKDEVRALGASSACPRAWSAVTRFPDRASPSASPARSRPIGSRSCAAPMPSISRRSADPGSTTRSGRPSPCCCPCAPSA
jgi:GMP synthase (glutamine-hydrolysing)